MRISVVTSLEKRDSSDALVVPYWKVGTRAEAACELGKLSKAVKELMSSGDFSANIGQTAVVYSTTAEEKRLIVIGLGEENVVTIETLRKSYASLVHACCKLSVVSLTIVLPQIELLDAVKSASAIMEGLYLANYRYTKLKSKNSAKNKDGEIVKVQFITAETALVEGALSRTDKIMKSVYEARNLVNGNADEVTPSHLANIAKAIAKSCPRMTCQAHDKKWLQKKQMGLFLAVARGSAEEPYFIVLSYKGNPSSVDHTVLVGKAITFDTGGLNLKVNVGIEVQKSDMSGAAAVLGTMKAIGELALPINVTAILASCDNAIGPNAYKPGDVYSGYTGKTVEITNTDAEGRLTLADALAFAAAELKPSRMIDLATLTGSCIIGLGHEVAALLSNSDTLAQALFDSSERTHERVWRLPLYEEYGEDLKSDIADIKNAGSREGGAIKASVFLKEFVGNVPWAHLDIAGVAFNDKPKSYLPRFGTGFGVRLLVDFLTSLCEKER